MRLVSLRNENGGEKVNQTALAKRSSTQKLVLTGMLVAISIILDATPIGTIRLPIVSATIAHVPTIIGGMTGGPLVGGIVGLSFGLASLIRNLTQPTSILSFAFMNPLVSVLPRILVGIMAYYGYYGIQKFANDYISIIAGAMIGSCTNTVLVLGMMYILYAQRVVEAFSAVGKSGTAKVILLGIATANGIPEMIVAAILTVVIVKGLKKIYNI
ncbi:ECF transporter S component [Defluviitalea raffinosedens]|uniref:ECF transporter S component n=1 Tax=Defluviitalea raffinosedens TaxID=1450156 RepID=A0A7C8HG16_9FIRM|nr:ECF transporter S component [Defluviitalea raffinosedens]KAE9636363.1 ECF transporter S component [Defluviitalea raffinosedens]HHW66194.1 ECF transporter S component [Candidatus Epulonipiscium sp.]